MIKHFFLIFLWRGTGIVLIKALNGTKKGLCQAVK